MNRPKVSLPILLPWEKAMAYCRGSTIQIYYSPHSLSACTKLQISRASDNNYLSGRESQSKDLATEFFGRGRKGRNCAWEIKFRKCLCYGICAKGAMERLSYKGKPRDRGTERRGVPLWNDWNALKGKTPYWPFCLICMSKATSAI